MTMILGRLLSVLAFCALLGACGGAEIGESCEGVGSGDDCVDHAICTNEEGDALRCRAVCKETEECPPAHSCNGVSSTSIKSCQPD